MYDFFASGRAVCKLTNYYIAQQLSCEYYRDMQRPDLVYRQGEELFGSRVYPVVHTSNLLGFLPDGTCVEKGSVPGEVKLYSHEGPTRTLSSILSAEKWYADEKLRQQVLRRRPSVNLDVPASPCEHPATSGNPDPVNKLRQKLVDLFPQLKGNVLIEPATHGERTEVFVPVGFGEHARQVMNTLPEHENSYIDIRIQESTGLHARLPNTASILEKVGKVLAEAGVYVFDIVPSASDAEYVVRVQDCTVERVRRALMEQDIVDLAVESISQEAWSLLQAMNTRIYLSSALQLPENEITVTPVSPPPQSQRHTFRVSLMPKTRKVSREDVLSALSQADFLDDFEVVLAA